METELRKDDYIESNIEDLEKRPLKFSFSQLFFLFYLALFTFTCILFPSSTFRQKEILYERCQHSLFFSLSAVSDLLAQNGKHSESTGPSQCTSQIKGAASAILPSATKRSSRHFIFHQKCVSKNILQSASRLDNFETLN